MTNFVYSPILLLPLLISIVCDNSTNITENSVSPKIIGGRPVENRVEFGFIVSLRLNNLHICGGSIIDDRHILTAAHCCFDAENNRKHPPKRLSILAGTLLKYPTVNSGIVKNVERVIVHEWYDPEYVVNDIALIQIVGKFNLWTSILHPIPLSTAFPRSRKMCKVAGWGIIEYNTTKTAHRLLYVDLPIIDKNLCRRFYNNLITSEMICAGGNGVDSCQGDSGGTLVCDGTLDGIVSWGNGCGIYPGVYTAVSKYLLWIAKHIGNNSKINNINIYFILINLIIVLCYL